MKVVDLLTKAGISDDDAFDLLVDESTGRILYAVVGIMEVGRKPALEMALATGAVLACVTLSPPSLRPSLEKLYKYCTAEVDRLLV